MQKLQNKINEKSHFCYVNMFAKFDDILMKNIIMKNILQYFPIVKINKARITKTWVVVVFLHLFLIGSSKMLFPWQIRNLQDFLYLKHVKLLYYIVDKYHKPFLE